MISKNPAYYILSLHHSCSRHGFYENTKYLFEKSAKMNLEQLAFKMPQIREFAILCYEQLILDLIGHLRIYEL